MGQKLSGAAAPMAAGGAHGVGVLWVPWRSPCHRGARHCEGAVGAEGARGTQGVCASQGTGAGKAVPVPAWRCLVMAQPR